MVYCPNCGARMDKQAAFCSVCGGPVPAETQAPAGEQRRPRRLLSALLGAALPILVALALLLTGLLPLGASPAPARIEGPGFATPEEAIDAFLSALKQGDYAGMLSTFAVETRAEHLDLEARFSYSDYSLLTGDFTVGGLPAVSELSAALDREGFRSDTARSIYDLYLSLLLRDTPYLSREYVFFGGKNADPDEKAALLSALSGQVSFADLEPIRLWDCEELFHDRSLERFHKSLERTRAAAGAEEVRELSMELKLEGEAYVVFFTLARFDGRWYLLRMGNTLSGYLKNPDLNSYSIQPASALHSWMDTH